MTKGPFCEFTSNTQRSIGLRYWGGKFERRLTTKYLTRKNPKPKEEKNTHERALITSAAAVLLLGGSMISAPAVLAHRRLTPYHSHIHQIVSPTPDSPILNASSEDGLTDWNNRHGNTSLIASGQRSGTALQVTAGSAEYHDVSARVQEAVPDAGMGVQGWDSSSDLQINTVSELAAYSTGYRQVSTTSAGWWSRNGSAWVTADARGTASTGSTGDTGSTGGTSGGSTGGSTGGTTVLFGDWATYNISNGPYWAYNSTWNRGSLVNGKDFTQSLTLDNANFPNGSVLAWSWPNTPAPNNVYSSPCLMFGTYAQVAAPTPTIPYKQINAINALTVTHNVTLSGDPTEFDAIYDFYLQSSTDTSTQGLFEIELHMHTPQYFIDWINRSLTKYNFTDAGGTNWIIARNRDVSSPMIIFVRADFADNLNTMVDLKALLMAAKANGLLTGNEYFTGLAMAVEPREGSGSMTIDSLSVTYN
jgi:hypothetical protein